jgi:CrcB protein
MYPEARYRRAMPAILLVMIGGAFGSAARYLVGRATFALLGPNYPWGTLTVNIVGGFLMGLLAGLLARASSGGEHIRLLAAVGALGGFTTFSAFSLDVVLMVERGEWLSALAYVLASVLGATLALSGGLLLVRAFP